MRLVWTFLFLVFSIIGHVQYYSVNAQGQHEEEGEEPKNYVNHWVVEIEGGRDHAETVASQHGFVVESKFMSIPDHYQLIHSDVPHRSKRSAHHHTKRLSEDSRIKFVEQQHEKVRVKRGHRYNRALAAHIARSSGNLNDPKFHDQWYLNEHKPSDDMADMNVKRAWRVGATGRGVKVTILDDGLESNHPDLAANYDPSASYDFNGNDPDPMPRYDPTNENKHGTRCAGEIAMVANNGQCGVGVAFNARIGGVRMLDGKVTDRVEAEAIGFAKHVHISSASWGPSDDGKTLERPGKVAQKGMNESITLGRDGKGSIMVWAAGNGAHYDDNCNCDGYTSDYRTLSISSASEHGFAPWYSEQCSSTLAATYSSGNVNEKKVVSADLHGKCTAEHSGTSAAAPMAAGLIALALEKNQNLTWRDVQHIVVVTSRSKPLRKNDGWYRNGVGLCVNHAFGFGLMDALGLVKLAQIWENVSEQKICRVTADTDALPKRFSTGNSIEIEIKTDGCKGQDQEVNFLEHIQVILTLGSTRRGNVYVEIESPMGTITPLMTERRFDTSKAGFKEWPLMSTHTWGENPSGTWKLRAADRSATGSEQSQLQGLELVLLGTRDKPFYHDSINKEGCGVSNRFPTMKVVEVEEDPMYKLKHLFGNLHLT